MPLAINRAYLAYHDGEPVIDMSRLYNTFGRRVYSRNLQNAYLKLVDPKLNVGTPNLRWQEVMVADAEGRRRRRATTRSRSVASSCAR